MRAACHFIKEERVTKYNAIPEKMLPCSYLQIEFVELDDEVWLSYVVSIIYSFQERLAAQRKEREMTTAELGFKKQLTKEEKFEKKKQRLAAIGNDL